MMTDAQIAANRNNALKSTGPRTDLGKRRAASNARKHGLSMPPPSARVLDWYNRIVGGLKGNLGQPEGSALRDAAMALAEAEAALERVRDAEEDFLYDLAEDRHLDMHLRTVGLKTRYIRRSIRDTSPEVEWILLEQRGLARGEIHHEITERWTTAHIHHARLARYRRDAEVRRHKVLRAWIGELEARFSETNPIAA